MNNKKNHKKSVLIYKFDDMEVSSVNIGDYIQSLAALSIVNENWKNLNFINRERLFEEPKEKTKLIANGWYTHNQNTFPVNEKIDPLFISVHVNKKLELTKEVINNFKKFQPIGCRDQQSVEKLKENGVDAYFSGCLTLSLPKRIKKRKGIVFVVDNIQSWGNWCDSFEKFKKWKGSKVVIEELLKNYKLKEIKKAKFLIQQTDKNKKIEWQFKRAEKWLDTLSSAELVVTTRIHSLMPSIAMGTPSLYIMKNNKDSRFEGLSEHWNYIDFTSYKKENKVVFNIKRDKDNNIINKNTHNELSEKNNKAVNEFWNK